MLFTLPAYHLDGTICLANRRAGTALEAPELDGESLPPYPDLTHLIGRWSSAVRNEPPAKRTCRRGGWVREGGGLSPCRDATRRPGVVCPVRTGMLFAGGFAHHADQKGERSGAVL